MRCDVAIQPEMLDEAACRAWWLRQLHPMGGVCPVCGVSITGPVGDAFAQGRLIRCPDCRRQITMRTGTIVSGIKADWRQLLLLVAMTSRGDRIADIAAACNLSADTIRRYIQRLQQ